ncbi:hypothetical protein J6590_050312 [Homalodisca vitripennis]|nr:hypothetical protein J6590_050312 [Homalodisca vitripennis]
MPGARLLDVVSLDQTSEGARPLLRVADRRHQRPGSRRAAKYLPPSRGIHRCKLSQTDELVLATLPHHHDLDIDNPIHDQNMLVNTFTAELAIRNNIRVLNFYVIGWGFFTRHGQDLSMRVKWLLVGMIKESLATLSPSPPVTAGPTRTPLPPPGRFISSTTLPVVPWGSRLHDSSISHMQRPDPACSRRSKLMVGPKIQLRHQNCQPPINKMYD